MKKPFIYAAALAASALAVGIGSAAQAQTEQKPEQIIVPIRVGVGESSQSIQLSLDLVDFDSKTNAAIYAYTGEPITLTFGEDLFQLDGYQLGTDPFISFAASFTDFGAPSPFPAIGLVPTPLNPPIQGMAKLWSSLGITMTDGGLGGGTPGGVGITLPGNPANANIATYKVNGTTVGGLGNAVPIGAPGGTQVVGPLYWPGPTQGNVPPGSFNNTFTYNCPVGGCINFTQEISFTGTGGGDQYGLTGRLDIVPMPPINGVPEPSATAAVVGVGLLGLTFLRRRKDS